VKTSPVVLQTVAFAAPIGLCVAVRRSRTRDVAVCALQMWAYLAAYKTPHDDEAAQRERVRIDYPIVLDRIVGLGDLPTLRLQRALARWDGDRARWTVLDRILVWTHWMWFAMPHASLAYILVFRRERFSRAAVVTYAVFDIGAIFYWLVPTAPPWYAVTGEQQPGIAPGDEHAPKEVVTPAVRRMMVEYGEDFWGDGWDPLYSVLGGNPLAAMPSLHFATSVMAALLLSETGPLAGAVGWTYAVTLGFALVYLGEHYAVDLIAGAALTGAVRGLGGHARPLLEYVGRGVAALEEKAHGP
jgi:membrane-associated phospholipid phosphatase